MPVDKTPAALKFFDSVIEKHGFNPDHVASALAALDNSLMEDVQLRIKTHEHDGPHTALEIYGVDTDVRHRPQRMPSMDATATDYMRGLSRRIGYGLTSAHGYVGNRQGYAHMGRDYFVAESGLLLPRGGFISLRITMPAVVSPRELAAAR
ncbi:MAG: hypothetical protein HY515_03920 [Candidatus Aenigmarchaeota archaeon]|nr:hypothetical protein [Candidatus Aenigmarchaeota archaeon]